MTKEGAYYKLRIKLKFYCQNNQVFDTNSLLQTRWNFAYIQTKNNKVSDISPDIEKRQNLKLSLSLLLPHTENSW